MLTGFMQTVLYFKFQLLFLTLLFCTNSCTESIGFVAASSIVDLGNGQLLLRSTLPLAVFESHFDQD